MSRNERGPRGRSRPGGRGGKRPNRTENQSSEKLEELHPTEDPPEVENFRHWDLGEEIQAAIEGMGIERPTPIQALAIGPVLEGRDVIAKAETGTGKTLAFGAPIMARIDTERSTVLALVLCPTRELAQQVASVLTELGKPRDIGVALVVGGDEMHPQVQALRAGAQVVVGTPGRVLDLYNQRFLQFPWTEYVVLDEADEMLEIGFLPDVQKILSFIPEERNTLLFSATFPPALLRLARSETRNPAEIATAKGVATVENITQSVIHLDEIDRGLALVRLIETSQDDDVFLVFCERRTDVDRLMRRLERLPYGIRALHGGYDQAARFRVMSAFRTGEVKALIATDVASRGIDIAHVTHVVNLHPPKEISTYTHRIGRTGRAGRKGHAITLVTAEDDYIWRGLKRSMKWDVEEAELPARHGRAGRSERPRREREQRGRGRSESSSRDESRGRRSEGDRQQRGRQRSNRVEEMREGRQERIEREMRERLAKVSGDRAKREASEKPETKPSSEREERPRRGSRSKRDERPHRESSGEREERPRRGSRSEREERPRRESSGEREERPRRRSRSERDERPRHESSGEREERPRRESRGEREERPRRESRGEREELPRRESRGEREERPRRESRGEREERPRRESRGEREERPRRESRSEREGTSRQQRPREEQSKRESRQQSKPDLRNASSSTDKAPEKPKRSTPRPTDEASSSFGAGL